MPAKRKFNSAAVQELYDEVVGSDPSSRDQYEKELVNIEVARWIHDMPTEDALARPNRRCARRHLPVRRGARGHK